MIRIVTDTTSALDPAWTAAHHIPLIPQVIVFGQESFLEVDEISTEEFLRRLMSSKIVAKTAAPPPGLFIKAFEELDAGHNTIICIHPTSDLSGTVRSAITAKQEAFPDADIRIIDTRTVGSQLATLVMLAQRWLEEGADADTIISRIEALTPRQRTYFMVDTLEYLQRGGRISGSAAMLGQLLQIKPILQLNEGRIDVLVRERTKKRAMARMKELVMESIAADVSPCLQVQHCLAGEDAAALTAYFAQALGRDDILTFNLVPAIVTHAGPGTIGVSFFAKQ